MIGSKVNDTMGILDKLERHLGRFGVKNISLYLIIGQAAVFILTWTQPELREHLTLVPHEILQGEVWRLITFAVVPTRMNPLFILFAWYIFWLMGSTLENYWGGFRYNLFLLIGYGATVGSMFILYLLLPEPEKTQVLGTNSYLYSSVFLAFAYLYPDFELRLFFVLPVKIKWLALITWGAYAFQLMFGGWLASLSVLAASLNFLLFFGRDIVSGAKASNRRLKRNMKLAEFDGKPRHKCEVCGMDSNRNPLMDFRYCSKCKGQRCYCPEHLWKHEHK